MKKAFIALVAIIGFVVAGCSQPTDVTGITPTAEDFEITAPASKVVDGSPKTVNIKPKEGKSQGTITIWYTGIEDTNYARSTTAPSAAGKYAVTFDVAADVGFKAATGLKAGTLTIAVQTANPVDPAVSDFDISGLSAIYDNTAKAVSITSKTGKSQGRITIWYEGTEGTTYLKSTTAPSAAGKYAVTFDVAADVGFNAKTGLAAGTLTIEKQIDNPVDPKAEDFNISGLEANYDGSPKEVSITPKTGKSQGRITIWYTGTVGTNYARSETAPSAVGKYAVTFDVAESKGFKAAKDLKAGTLIISSAVKEEISDPSKIIDFESGWDATGYAERSVSWGGYGWTVSGVVTTTDDNDRKDGTKSIRLRGNTGDNCRVELDSYLTGIKSVYFDYASYSTHNSGIISVYYQIKGSDWVKAGEVTAPAWEGDMLNAKIDINKTNVRFKIVRDSNLASYTSVNVDNIIITADSEASFNVVAVDPVPSDFNISGLDAIYDGTSKAVSITPKVGKSQGQITVYYAGSTTVPTAGGSYAVTFDVAAAEGFNAKTGLVAGTLVIEVINDPHIVVDFEDSVWDATGYAKRTVIWSGYEWTVSGVVSTSDSSDRKDRDRSLRFRGGNAADTGDNTNRIELVSYFSSIKAISFDYGSYSTHSGGTITVFYQIEGGDWVEAGKVENIPSWADGGSKMLNAKFNVNQTGKVRFKIEKFFVGSGSISANIDNIVITANSPDAFTPVPVDPAAGDFNITGLHATADGTAKEVSITPKAGKSQGTITVYYEGTAGTTYTKSTTAPSAAGSYAVTFDVAAAAGFNAKNGLAAGTLTITAQAVITDPYFLIDFEGSEWAGTGYAKRSVTSGGRNWTVSGVGTMDGNDRKDGDRSIRFRGGNTADTGDNTNRVELTDYLTSGIKSISFDYGSYSSHSGGTITVFYQKQGETDWTEAGKVENIPSWTAAGSELKNAKFDVNQTGNIRFKIEKLFVGSGSISVNVDNIRITY